jgi:hypothetical protein
LSQVSKIFFYFIAFVKAVFKRSLVKFIIITFFAIQVIQFLLELAVAGNLFPENCAVVVHALTSSDDQFWKSSERYNFDSTEYSRKIIIAVFFWGFYGIFKVLWRVAGMILPSTEDIIREYNLIASASSKKKT